MLNQVANWCTVVSRNTIVRNSTSLGSAWQAIRLHYGFQSTGAHFVDFASIRPAADDRPEDLYQHLQSFIEDNLLRAGGNITHHGDEITEDEDLTPSLENMIVLTWLGLLHKDLPRLVKQRYGTELRSRTLASIKPEISQAMDSLLEELKSTDDTRIMRAATYNTRNHTHPRSKTAHYGSEREFHKPKTTPSPRHRTANPKSCPICKGTARNSDHFLSSCKFLPESDKRFMLRARQISSILDEQPVDDDSYNEEEDDDDEQDSTVVFRVQVRQSPYI